MERKQHFVAAGGGGGGGDHHHHHHHNNGEEDRANEFHDTIATTLQRSIENDGFDENGDDETLNGLLTRLVAEEERRHISENKEEEEEDLQQQDFKRHRRTTTAQQQQRDNDNNDMDDDDDDDDSEFLLYQTNLLGEEDQDLLQAFLQDVDDDDIDIFDYNDQQQEQKESNSQQQQQQHEESTTPHHYEDIIAKKMANLSMEEREKVYYEIHGVSENIKETESFVDEKLIEFQKQLDFIIPPNQKVAYEMARTMDRSYVDNTEFQLRFLRADRWDTNLAATRYAKHYEMKFELFDIHLLTKDIQQNDLDKESIEALYSGYVQILNKRDNAGRLVSIFIANSKFQQYSTLAKMRSRYYRIMLESEDIETQRNGIVGIMFALNQQLLNKGNKGSDNIRNMTRLARALPIKRVGLHFCYDNYMWLPAISIFALSSNIFSQLRLNAHCGSYCDCMYKLQTFGLPTDIIPIDQGGNICVDYHIRFLKRCQNQEQECLKNKTTRGESKILYPKMIVPGRCDVLLCRGKVYVNHVGNVRYRCIIENFLEKYNKSSKSERQKVAEEVLNIVHQYSGRFLKDDEGIWIEADNAYARRQICHSFRALLYDSTLPSTDDDDDEDETKHGDQHGKQASASKNPQNNGGSSSNSWTDGVAGSDSNDKVVSKVTIPTRNDVLLGRGKGHFNHVGNIRFRGLVEDFRKQYETATRSERPKISQEVVSAVHKYGGRFLKDDGDGKWVVIDDKAARVKVTHSFRALRGASSSSAKKSSEESIGTNKPTLNDGKERRGHDNAAPTTKRMFRE